jgi:hypothetical protein
MAATASYIIGIPRLYETLSYTQTQLIMSLNPQLRRQVIAIYKGLLKLGVVKQGMR